MAARSQLGESPLAQAGQSPVSVELKNVRSEAEAGTVLVLSSESAAVARAPSSGAAGKLTPAQCPICLEELADGEDDITSTALPGCSHAFHSSCVGEWFRRAPAPTCPSCRRDMTEQRAYVMALAANDLHLHAKRGSEEAAAAVLPRRVRVFRRHRRRAALGVRYVARSSQQQQQVPPGIIFRPVVLTPRDDAPLFQFDPTI